MLRNHQASQADHAPQNQASQARPSPRHKASQNDVSAHYQDCQGTNHKAAAHSSTEVSSKKSDQV